MRKVLFAVVTTAGLVLMLGVGSYALAGDDLGNNNKQQFKSDTMNGYQEVVGPGPISTTGIGSFEAELDGAVITYTLTYEALEGGAVTQAHIHFGQRSVGGGVIAFLCGGPKPPCPPAGTVTGTITPADVIGPTNQGIEAGSFGELLRALRSGNVYPNVHTTRWPAGEIRGQVNDENQRQSG